MKNKRSKYQCLLLTVFLKILQSFPTSPLPPKKIHHVLFRWGDEIVWYCKLPVFLKILQSSPTRAYLPPPGRRSVLSGTHNQASLASLIFPILLFHQRFCKTPKKTFKSWNFILAAQALKLILHATFQLLTLSLPSDLFPLKIFCKDNSHYWTCRKGSQKFRCRRSWP